MSKERITCRTHCPTWNSEDKDCEIYGEHHFTPRTCPHYNKELKQEMTDKLKPGYHYAIVNDCEAIFEKYKDLKYPYCHGNCCTEYKYLAPVPSYEEWEQLQNWADFTNDYHELREKLEIAEYKNAQLKELLKECKNILEEQTFYRNTISETDETFRTRIVKKAEILSRIFEVLK